jgi:hypothetical protein
MIAEAEAVTRDPASYRDPAGHVYRSKGTIYRSILTPGADHYRAARDSGFLESAAASGRLIAGTEVDRGVLAGAAPDALYVVEHPRLSFISYPYSWSFFGLRDAALLTLDLHLEALAHGLTLSDASAYNVQFVGPKPIFIDYLSFLRYQDGQVWLGYRQFCEQFLNPLLLTAKTGVPYHAWYRGTLEGIPPGQLAALLPVRVKLHPLVALHVVLQGRLQRRVGVERTAAAKQVRISKLALTANIRSMRNWVARL